MEREEASQRAEMGEEVDSILRLSNIYFTLILPPPLIHFDITPCERGLLSVVWRGLLSQKAHLSTVMITQFPVLVLGEYCKLAVHLLYKPLPVTLTGCQIL